MSKSYDVVIIGAGMSGLAAGIRLAMFDKKVVILEKHVISGGLNSYYTRRISESKELINLDVGLHALTNFAKKKEKGLPLTKLLKQLRIPYESLKLKEQTYSLIKFKSAEIKFSNDFELLKSEVADIFPKEIDSLSKFSSYISEYNEVDLNSTYLSARSVIDTYFKEELLKEMIIAPLLIYGSAWEDDMDFSQFVIMFKSLYFEGFSRPEGGVRTIIDLLLEKYSNVGGELRFKTEVERIDTKKTLSGNKILGVSLKSGEYIKTQKILSSAGLPETFSMVSFNTKLGPKVGKLSFTETIYLLNNKSVLSQFDPTIIFYNSTDKYSYRMPNTLYDHSSAVFCLPDNYNRSDTSGHATVRVTYMANFNLWNNLSKEDYRSNKESVFNNAKALGVELFGQKISTVFHDVFTPTTVKRYTKHFQGTVYGSTSKLRDGRTEIDGLYIIGTDQGFLGIVGSILSGISMANLHGLME